MGVRGIGFGYKSSFGFSHWCPDRVSRFFYFSGILGFAVFRHLFFLVFSLVLCFAPEGLSFFAVELQLQTCDACTGRTQKRPQHLHNASLLIFAEDAQRDLSGRAWFTKSTDIFLQPHQRW